MPPIQMESSETDGQHAWPAWKLEQRDGKDEKESSGNDRNKKHSIRDSTRGRLTTAEVRISEVENRSTESQKKERTEGNIWRNNSQEFVKHNERYQTTDPRSIEDPKQDKYQNHITSKLLKTKNEEKNLKSSHSWGKKWRDYIQRNKGEKLQQTSLQKQCKLGFPSGAVVKNPPANAGDMGSSPGPGRSHMPRSN